MKPMSDAAKANLAAFNAKQLDWWVVDPKTGKRVYGSLKDLAKLAQEHRDG